MIDALQNETKYKYDANGNRTAVIDARHNRTEYEYDAANRLIKITYPDLTTVKYTYNFRGQKETETDQLNRTTTLRLRQCRSVDKDHSSRSDRDQCYLR